MILGSQTHNVEKTIDKFNEDIQKVHESLGKKTENQEDSNETGNQISQNSSVVINQNQSSSQIIDNIDPTFYDGSPNQYDTQFQNEGKAAHKRIYQLLFTNIQQCTIANEDNMVRIDLNGFTESLFKTSNFMKSFEDRSLVLENETWTKYLSNVTIPIQYNKEEMESASILATLTTRRLQRQTDSEISNYFGPMFLQVNNLHQSIINQQEKEVQIQSKMKEKLIDYYDTLVNDLSKAIEETKKQEDSVKTKVYDETMKKVRKARSVTLQMRTTGILHDNNTNLSSPSESEPGSTFASQAQFNITPSEASFSPTQKTHSTSFLDNPIFNENLDENFLNEIDEKNQEMKKEILLHRCMRVLSEIGVKRYYKKVIVENIQQRKSGNAQLWDDKFKSEMIESSLDLKLQEAHHLLSDTKLEIEKLRQQLENAKMSSIQLVHWKATNIKKIENMKKKLEKFDETIEDVDVDVLVKKIADAQAELDELRENNNEMNSVIDEEVRKPMRIVEVIKNKVRESNTEKRKMRSLQIQSDLIHQEEVTNKELFVQDLSDANIQLRLANDQLNKQIQELENQKKMKSERAKTLMEETMRARQPLKMQTRASTRIVKPAVKKVVTRSLSRI